METLYLSTRNLLSLLSKLDGRRAGQVTHCALVKNDSTHAEFPQTMRSVVAAAVEDGAESDAYAPSPLEMTQDRHGRVIPLPRVILSRSDLQSMLNDLRSAEVARPLLKSGNADAGVPTVAVIAVRDERYYIDRLPGMVHPANDPGLRRPV